jgi:hypothetical protein
VAEGPHEELVGRLHRAIAAFAQAHGVETPIVEVELADSARFVLERIDPEPGHGLVTLHVHGDDDDAPDALIVPVGSIRRIELRRSPAERLASIGFSLPA